jgi:hypothetical protein
MAVDYNQLWRDPRWRGRMSGDTFGGSIAEKALGTWHNLQQRDDNDPAAPWMLQQSLDDIHAAMAYQQMAEAAGVDPTKMVQWGDDPESSPYFRKVLDYANTASPAPRYDAPYMAVGGQGFDPSRIISPPDYTDAWKDEKWRSRLAGAKPMDIAKANLARVGAEMKERGWDQGGQKSGRPQPTLTDYYQAYDDYKTLQEYGQAGGNWNEPIQWGDTPSQAWLDMVNPPPPPPPPPLPPDPPPPPPPPPDPPPEPPPPPPPEPPLPDPPPEPPPPEPPVPEPPGPYPWPPGPGPVPPGPMPDPGPMPPGPGPIHPWPPGPYPLPPEPPQPKPPGPIWPPRPPRPPRPGKPDDEYLWTQRSYDGPKGRIRPDPPWLPIYDDPGGPPPIYDYGRQPPQYDVNETPAGFTAGTAPATDAKVHWFNENTGRHYIAPNSGYQPPEGEGWRGARDGDGPPPLGDTFQASKYPDFMPMPTIDRTTPPDFDPNDYNEDPIDKTTYQAGLNPYIPPELPPGTRVGYEEHRVRPGEWYTYPQEARQMRGKVKQASRTGLEVPLPPRTNAQKYSSYVSTNTPEYSAAQGQISSESIVGDIQGAVSAEAQAQAAVGELDERATVQYQLGKLFESFEEGTPPPAWAAPAVRSVGAMMAQRGLGQSSMAAAAITQAMMESGIQVAKEDANKYATIQIANLNNRQQTALYNAGVYAAMDKSNLDARLTGAVNNSKAFLQIDTQNLNNRQQLKTIDLQSSFQKMFNDQAQINAASQFNAKSQMQVDQFFSELDTQVQNANSSRIAAMEQFNADQFNSSSKYFAKINDARDRFNIQNEAIIQQSNANWRRNINTANTNLANETNRLNALNLLGITQSSMDKLWQRYRDEASWAVQISENDKQKAHNYAILAQQQDFNAAQFEEDREYAFWESLGSTITDGIFGILGA